MLTFSEEVASWALPAEAVAEQIVSSAAASDGSLHLLLLEVCARERRAWEGGGGGGGLRFAPLSPPPRLRAASLRPHLSRTAPQVGGLRLLSYSPDGSRLCYRSIGRGWTHSSSLHGATLHAAGAPNRPVHLAR